MYREHIPCTLYINKIWQQAYLPCWRIIIIITIIIIIIILRQFLFSGEPKKTGEKNVCYRELCLNSCFCYIRETSQWWDEREAQHKRSIENKYSNNSFYIYLRNNPHHIIGWNQVTFLACDSCYGQRRMKELILNDVFSHKGFMNVEDDMKREACWNVLFPLLRK